MSINLSTDKQGTTDTSSRLATKRNGHHEGLQAVILDWAGTTMDFGCRAPAVAFVKIFEEFGVPITMAEAREPMGAHKKTHIRRITQIPAVAERWRKTYGREPNEGDVEKMFERFVPLQMSVLADYADLVPGTLETVKNIRARGLKIGSTTGYLRDMNILLLNEAKKRGYAPDVWVCAEDVPEGRPAPWMCLENARRLNVFPMSSIVKVGDTLPDIEEGLNAGMWTVGLAMTGNECGLGQDELAALSDDERERIRERAYKRLYGIGAHYVIDGIWDLPPVIDEIESRLRQSVRP